MSNCTIRNWEVPTGTSIWQRHGDTQFAWIGKQFPLNRKHELPIKLSSFSIVKIGIEFLLFDAKWRTEVEGLDQMEKYLAIIDPWHLCLQKKSEQP